MSLFGAAKCGKFRSWFLFVVAIAFVEEASGLFAHSSCQRDTQWEKGNGAPIKSFLKSVVQSNHPNPINPRLTATFNNKRRSFVSIGVGSQFKTKGWRKFGTKEFDGYLYGHFDNIKDMTGNNLTFVYPDYKTVLRGSWLEGNMVESKKAIIKGFRCHNGIMELKTTKTRPQGQTYTYEPTDINFITSYPKVMDPYDHATVFVKNSKIQNFDGLYAKKDIPQGSLVAYYAGLHVYHIDTIIFPNMTIDEKEDKHKNLLSFNDDYDLDCPGDLIEYRASLGHKANHAFENVNVDFGFVKSPRFGEIRCLKAIADINKGDEIYINYNYNIDSSYVPRWFKSLYYKTYPEKKKASAENTNSTTTGSVTE